MKEYWEKAEIDATNLIEDIRKGVITIPSFQRGVVWKKKQSQLLIDSIKNGYPFGSILLYEDNKGQKQLIDGLQRSMTIYGFLTRPADYFDISDIDDITIENILKLSKIKNSLETVKKDIALEIKKWIKNKHSDMESIKAIQFRDLADALVLKFNSLEGQQILLADILRNALKQFQNICGFLSQTKIPAIIYKGYAENLPIIFERINTRGTKLTKYQIYAASWTKDSIEITDEKLKKMVDIVADRYDKLGGDGEIKVDNYDSTSFKYQSKLNVFEIGYSFGKILYEKFPDLFGTNTNENQINSVGFNIINACLTKKVNEMSSLNKNLRGLGTDFEINAFLIRVLNVTQQIQKILSPLYMFKRNKRKDSIKVIHSELQITSIIAQAYKLKHIEFVVDDNNQIIESDDLGKNKRDWENNYKLLKRNLKVHYVSDLINEKWSGTGDSKLDHILQYNHEAYIKIYDRSTFIKELEIWFNKSNESKNEREKVANPTNLEKLMLNMIYSQEFSALQHLDDSKYDIEHLIPKNMLIKELKLRKGIKLPISSLGNLCLLPEYENRSKKDNLLYDDNQYSKYTNIEEIENKYTFTTKKDFKWLDDNLSDHEFSEHYNSYLQGRFNQLKDKIIKFLYE